jgi:radical SAM family RiPP maturation amino acid epimerase
MTITQLPKKDSNAKTVKIEHEWKYWRNPNNYSKELPLFKVALTEYVGDPKFKIDFEISPQKALIDRGFGSVDALSLSILTDKELANKYKTDAPETPKVVKEYRQFIAAKKLHAMSIRDVHVKHKGWETWRQRMVLATLWREGPVKYQRLVHAPFTIELTEGCTVGCWFCGVDAEKFQKPVELNNGTKDLYTSILHAFDQLAGNESAQTGFLYWATDPLDHPEYEWFLNEFHENLGFWPQTTTAQGMQHADRLRKMFKTIKNKNAFVQRFSMIRKKDLKEIRNYFTPEELFLCEQIPQYDNELSPKATSGRTRDIVLKKQAAGKKVGFHYNLEDTSSIACISGFLINLVNKSIKLITPCNATDKWPLGYRILGEAIFNEKESAYETIKKLLDENIENTFKLESKVKLIRGVNLACIENTKLRFERFGYETSIENIKEPEAYSKLIQDGNYTMSEICEKLAELKINTVDSMITLYKIRDLGVLDEGEF